MLFRLSHTLLASIVFLITYSVQAVPFTDKHQFLNSALIGKVFHDENENGVMDHNEFGVPGVRLATVTGLVLETDGFGRFHVPDVALSDTYAGRSYVLKIDPYSLPIGARVTTENPRVIRISNVSILNKINFGVSF